MLSFQTVASTGLLHLAVILTFPHHVFAALQVVLAIAQLRYWHERVVLEDGHIPDDTHQEPLTFHWLSTNAAQVALGHAATTSTLQ